MLKPKQWIGSDHYWYENIGHNAQPYFSQLAVLFPLTTLSHKAVWKEEEDHLLKWNLRSDGWELVEGELHPRGGEGGEAGWGGVSAKSPLTPLAVGGVDGDLPCCLTFRNVYQSLFPSTLNSCLFFLKSLTFICCVSHEIYETSWSVQFEKKKKWDMVQLTAGTLQLYELSVYIHSTSWIKYLINT